MEKELEIDENILRKRRIYLINKYNLQNQIYENENVMNMIEYKDLVMKTFKNRIEIFEEYKQKYRKLYKNIMYDSLNKDFTYVFDRNTEKMLYSIYSPNFYSSFPSKDFVKKAVLHHSQCIFNKINSLSLLSSSEEELRVNLITHRSLIDDEFYLKYGLSINQVMFLVFNYDLDLDEDIIESFERIGKR